MPSIFNGVHTLASDLFLELRTYVTHITAFQTNHHVVQFRVTPTAQLIHYLEVIKIYSYSYDGFMVSSVVVPIFVLICCVLVLTILNRLDLAAQRINRPFKLPALDICRSIYICQLTTRMDIRLTRLSLGLVSNELGARVYV